MEEDEAEETSASKTKIVHEPGEQSCISLKKSKTSSFVFIFSNTGNWLAREINIKEILVALLLILGWLQEN